MFFSRKLAEDGTLEHCQEHIEFFTRSNIVSHSTYDSFRNAQRGRVYGRRCCPSLINTENLARISQLKAGVDTCHYRVSAHPSDRNDGKILVFKSGNAIRAGKHTHEDSLRCMFLYNQFIRKLCNMHHEWHAAIDMPNMVLSGKLKKQPSAKFKHHWRCNFSSKFPGVAVATNEATTPEVYPRTSTFIIPGTTTAKSVTGAVLAINNVIDETADNDAETEHASATDANVGV